MKLNYIKKEGQLWEESGVCQYTTDPTTENRIVSNLRKNETITKAEARKLRKFFNNKSIINGEVII
jgi:hypothetical protein